MENPESGRILEFYISKNVEKIKFLKFSFTPKSQLLDEKLWVDENFEKLNEVIDELMKDSQSDYLKYEMAYFPNDKECKNEDEDNIILDNENSSENEDKPELKLAKNSKEKEKSSDIKEKILFCG